MSAIGWSIDSPSRNGEFAIDLSERQKCLGPRRSIPEESRCYVEFTDLVYKVATRKKKQKVILQRISGCFRPGRLTAIIGPSGAGKTTLLNLIAGSKVANVTGTISVNGHEGHRKLLRSKTSYVPQEFDLMPLLTARETLYIAARLKVGKDAKGQTPEAIIEEIADCLGLTNCLNTLVGKLSGGEKRRLSIGIEIVTNPPLLLLDEPTSGLDSAAASQVTSIMRSMAQSGCTVVCTIHQPSSQMISQFDDVMILNRGLVAYYGTQEDLLPTFAEAGYICPQFYNIGEFVLEVMSEQRNGDLDKLHKISSDRFSRMDYKCTVNDEQLWQSGDETKEVRCQSQYPISGFEQFSILLWRAMICIKRDNTLTKLRLATHIVVGIFLGAVFYQFGNDGDRVPSNLACLFFFLLFLYFANSMPAVQTFPVEASVFIREHSNNWYPLRIYYIVKTLSDLPLQIICSTCFLLTSYYMTGQPIEQDRFFRAWAICTLLSILGQLVGVANGTAFDTDLGMFLIPALSIPIFLFAGFFIKNGEVPTYFQPLNAISFFRYAFEGLVQAIYDGDRPKLNCSTIYCMFHYPKKILAFLDMPSMTFTTAVMTLMIWIVSLHVLIYVIFTCKLRNKKR